MLRFIPALLALLIFSSCATLLGSMDKDYRDRDQDPSTNTTGGRFTEGNWLRESDDSFPAHRENRAVAFEPGADPRSTAPRLESAGNGVAFSQQATYMPGGGANGKYAKRATKNDFMDESRGDGSLWNSDGQTNYYLTRNQVKSVGDLLTVSADEDFIKYVSMELKRSLSKDERDFEYEYAKEDQAKKLDALKGGAAGKANDPTRTPAAASAGEEGEKKAEPESDLKRDIAWADVDLKKFIDLKNGDPIMAEVVDRFPNGNYKIRGVKKVRFRNSLRYVSFLGVAKHADINDQDTIPAGKLYEYRLEALR